MSENSITIMYHPSTLLATQERTSNKRFQQQITNASFNMGTKPPPPETGFLETATKRNH